MDLDAAIHRLEIKLATLKEARRIVSERIEFNILPPPNRSWRGFLPEIFTEEKRYSAIDVTEILFKEFGLIVSYNTVYTYLRRKAKAGKYTFNSEDKTYAPNPLP